MFIRVLITGRERGIRNVLKGEKQRGSEEWSEKLPQPGLVEQAEIGAAELAIGDMRVAEDGIVG